MSSPRPFSSPAVTASRRVLSESDMEARHDSQRDGVSRGVLSPG
jgi:hypothetical protein